MAELTDEPAGEQIACEIEGTETDDGSPAISATCTECGRMAVVRGDDSKAVRRCLRKLRSKCPARFARTYVPDDDSLLDD